MICAKVLCTLYVRCVLSVLQKECRKVSGARYTLGAHYRSENTVFLLVPAEAQYQVYYFPMASEYLVNNPHLV
jgi:hypothetical protein